MELILGFLLGLIVGLLMCYVCLEQTVKFFHKLHIGEVKEEIKDKPISSVQEFADATNEQLNAQNEILKEWLFGKEGEDIG